MQLQKAFTEFQFWQKVDLSKWSKNAIFVFT